MGNTHYPHQSKFIQVDLNQILVIDFEHKSCFGIPKGIRDPDIKQNTPKQLEKVRISNRDWRQWMKQLDQIQKLQQNVFQKAFIEVFTCSNCFGYLPLSKCSEYQKAMKQWQDDINQTLEKHGMFIKTQTMILLYGRDNHLEKATISIALNSEESSKLAREPHIVAQNCWYCSACCGPSDCIGCVNKDRVI